MKGVMPSGKLTHAASDQPSHHIFAITTICPSREGLTCSLSFVRAYALDAAVRLCV